MDVCYVPVFTVCFVLIILMSIFCLKWKSKYLILEKGISIGIHELKMMDLIDSILSVTGPSLFRNDKCG